MKLSDRIGYINSKTSAFVTDGFLVYDKKKLAVFGCTNICYEQEFSIKLPKTVRYIHRKVFNNTKIVSFDASACAFLILGESCFEKCFSLKEVILPDFGHIKNRVFAEIMDLIKSEISFFQNLFPLDLLPMTLSRTGIHIKQ